MRASRLVSLLLLLQTRGRMTARELADELDVSVRTVFRDVEELSAAGIPVYADRGAAGGFQLVEGYRTRLTGLTNEEAESLFLSGYPGPAAQLGLGTVLAAAQLKVLAALPPELRGRASRVRQRFHLDAPGWFQEPESGTHLVPIADAVWSDRRLRIVYRRGEDGSVVERVVDPLGVVLKGGIWYMVGRVDGGFRTYRVARIVELASLDERFERPDDFDLAAYWDRSVTTYVGSFPTFAGTVLAGQDAVDRLELVYGTAEARAIREAAGAPGADGRLTLRLRLEDLWRAVSTILTLGPDAEVIDPPDLRARVAEAADRLAARYAGE